MSPEWREKEFDIPLRRVGTPQEIAALVRFLCGPDAGFFTGQTISPNGGAVMV
jgi:3-oxoacyl-[acyl-carrier protein] reductase